VAAGFELGNHTFSHADLHAVGPDRFLAEIARGDSVTAALLAARGQRPRFFRHPYLHTGRSLAVRERVDSALSARGYRVAPVTIDDRDWEFAEAYEEAIERRDAGLKERIATAYLAYMDVVFGYYEAESRALLGRELPQILLLHANALNADRFGALAGMMARRGYRFVPLERALADPAYGLPDRYIGPRGPSWLLRWAITRGTRSPDLDDEPRPPGFVRRLAAPTGR
jgi:peptidoglycan/xylan/chitin deacetylase (PgdA/CDA1 family)